MVTYFTPNFMRQHVKCAYFSYHFRIILHLNLNDNESYWKKYLCGYFYYSSKLRLVIYLSFIRQFMNNCILITYSTWRLKIVHLPAFRWRQIFICPKNSKYLTKQTTTNPPLTSLRKSDYLKFIFLKILLLKRHR